MIHHLIAAVEALDVAELLCPAPDKRKEIQAANESLRLLLRKCGCFVGKRTQIVREENPS